MDRFFNWFFEHPVLFIVIAAIVAVVASIVWANLVYDGDYRCIFAECRIQK